MIIHWYKKKGEYALRTWIVKTFFMKFLSAVEYRKPERSTGCLAIKGWPGIFDIDDNDEWFEEDGDDDLGGKDGTVPVSQSWLWYLVGESRKTSPSLSDWLFMWTKVAWIGLLGGRGGVVGLDVLTLMPSDVDCGGK